jgi:hypothetical protein
MPKTLLEMGPRDCRYIVAEYPHFYCDERARNGSCFCDEHHRLCYVPGTRRFVRLPDGVATPKPKPMELSE